MHLPKVTTWAKDPAAKKLFSGKPLPFPPAVSAYPRRLWKRLGYAALGRYLNQTRLPAGFFVPVRK